MFNGGIMAKKQILKRRFIKKMLLTKFHKNVVPFVVKK